MSKSESDLRKKFYLAPDHFTYEQLKELDQKFVKYPGLTLEQAKEVLISK